jgi:hypothetical protein
LWVSVGRVPNFLRRVVVSETGPLVIAAPDAQEAREV